MIPGTRSSCRAHHSGFVRQGWRRSAAEPELKHRLGQGQNARHRPDHSWPDSTGGQGDRGARRGSSIGSAACSSSAAASRRADGQTRHDDSIIRSLPSPSPARDIRMAWTRGLGRQSRGMEDLGAFRLGLCRFPMSACCSIRVTHPRRQPANRCPAVRRASTACI